MKPQSLRLETLIFPKLELNSCIPREFCGLGLELFLWGTLGGGIKKNGEVSTWREASFVTDAILVLCRGGRVGIKFPMEMRRSLLKKGAIVRVKMLHISKGGEKVVLF